eukprot:892696-Pelagomonas_calceolata.AAC.10
MADDWECAVLFRRGQLKVLCCVPWACSQRATGNVARCVPSMQVCLPCALSQETDGNTLRSVSGRPKRHLGDQNRAMCLTLIHRRQSGR